jgi:hypothetical protein
MPDSACVVVDDEPGLRSMIADYLQTAHKVRRPPKRIVRWKHANIGESDE